MTVTTAPLAALLNIRDMISAGIKKRHRPEALSHLIESMDASLPEGAHAKTDYTYFSNSVSTLATKLLPGCSFEVRTSGLVRVTRKVSLVCGQIKGYASTTANETDVPEAMLKSLALCEALIMKNRAEHAATFDPLISGSTNPDTSTIRESMVAAKAGDQAQAEQTRPARGSLRPVGFKPPGSVSEARSTTGPIRAPGRSPFLPPGPRLRAPGGRG